MTQRGIDLMQLRKHRRVLQDAQRLAKIAHSPAEVVELLARMDAPSEELKTVIRDPEVLMVALVAVARQVLPHLDSVEECLRELQTADTPRAERLLVGSAAS